MRQAKVGWWLAAALWSAFVLAETLTPRPWILAPSGTATLAHFAGFLVFGLLAAAACAVTGWRPAWGPAGLLVLGLGLVTEGGQFWVPGRWVDVADYLADASGAAVGIAAMLAFLRHRRRGRSSNPEV
jgi:VanZ family protein